MPAQRKPRVRKTKIDTLYAEWRKATEAVEKVAGRFGQQYKNKGLSVKDIQLYVKFWLADSCHQRLCDVVVDYPEAAPFLRLVHDPVFSAIVLEMANRREEWPTEAVPAFKDYLYRRQCRVPEKERTAVVRVLYHLSKQDGFSFSGYRGLIFTHGGPSLCRRLIEDERQREHIAKKDYDFMVDRFKKSKDYQLHPLEILAAAKGIPSRVVKDIVEVLIEVGLFRTACRVVNNSCRDDLLPVLEEEALKFTDLYEMRKFFEECPKADKKKFREVVRKMITPDPEDMIDAFLDGSEHDCHSIGRMMVFGSHPWMSSRDRLRHGF